MRQRDLEHLALLVQDIANPHAEMTRSDAVALLILLRDSAPANSMLRDLGHSVAHDTRDRGQSFEYMEKFARKVHRYLVHGGRLIAPLVFPIDDVLREINDALKSLGIILRVPVDDARVLLQLTEMFGDALEGTTFKLKFATGTLYSLDEANEGRLYVAGITFNHDIHGVGEYRAGITIAFEWMLDFDRLQNYRQMVAAADDETTPA